uniref:Uncharacterized protein n=1 Tax=Arundo donax TaxID=35708 RepID=A0A0A9ESY9_ARUDO
MWRVAKRVTP